MTVMKLLHLTTFELDPIKCLFIKTFLFFYRKDKGTLQGNELSVLHLCRFSFYYFQFLLVLNGLSHG